MEKDQKAAVTTSSAKLRERDVVTSVEDWTTRTDWIINGEPGRQMHGRLSGWR